MLSLIETKDLAVGDLILIYDFWLIYFGVINPRRTLIRVVLPDPLAPNRPMISFYLISNDSFDKTFTLSIFRLRFSTSSMF